MSLLMDALRRAEEAKRQAGAAGDSAASLFELSLDPLDTPSTSPSRSPSTLTARSSAVEADVAATTIPPPPSSQLVEPVPGAGVSSSQTSERRAANQVFAVKRAAAPRRSLWPLFWVAGTVMLVVGGYFWWQLQSVSVRSLANPVAPTASPAVTLPPAGPVQSGVSSLAKEAPLPVSEPPRSLPVPPPSASPPERARRDIASAPPREPAGVFRAGSNRTRNDQTLNLAYESWQLGRPDEARRGYEQVLHGDPRNADALLGMAAIAASQGQFDLAHDYYLRVLEVDPTDATAQAALIGLRGPGDSAVSESRLKTLLASQPEVPALHFALGNLYARRGHWSDAQQAYFQAYALAPDNADYIFNVAVSLDHLRQNKLAAQYYRMALAAAETGRGAFDRNAAAKRILELQP